MDIGDMDVEDFQHSRPTLIRNGLRRLSGLRHWDWATEDDAPVGICVGELACLPSRRAIRV